MKFTNSVNGVVSKFFRLDYSETLLAEMLVMERIYPIDYRAHEIEKRALWYDVFLDKMEQLHKAEFVHRNIRRPSDITGQPFDNILLANNGIRLIDVGISALLSQVGDKLYNKYLETVIKELQEFKAYLLSR